MPAHARKQMSEDLPHTSILMQQCYVSMCNCVCVYVLHCKTSSSVVLVYTKILYSQLLLLGKSG